MYDIYVIRGNAAVFKCHIPSFVADHVLVVSWHDTEGGEYILNASYGILQCSRIHFKLFPFVSSPLSHLNGSDLILA